MAYFHSTRISTDNIIMSFDTANIKSFRGEPTENLINNPDFNGTLNSTSPITWDGGGTSTIRRITNSTLFKDTNAWEVEVTLNGTTGFITSSEFNLLENTTYTVSIWVEEFNHLGGNFPIISLFNTSISTGFRSIGRTTISNEQPSISTSNQIINERISFTFTTSSSSTNSIIRIGSPHTSSGGYLRVSKIQFEQKPYPTPFVNGIRGTTVSTGGGLFDITQNNNHGELVNGPTFSGSNLGILQFDGVNDFIRTNYGGGINVIDNPISISAWIRSSITSGQRMWLDGGGNGTNQRLYAGLVTSERADFGIQGDLWASGIPIDTDWHHQVLVMDNGIARYYDNSIEVHTKNYTSYNINGDIIFGGRGTSFQWLGDIGSISIYDKVLTPEEIQQNFNATKGRYGL